MNDPPNNTFKISAFGPSHDLLLPAILYSTLFCFHYRILTSYLPDWREDRPIQSDFCLITWPIQMRTWDWSHHLCFDGNTTRRNLLNMWCSARKRSGEPGRWAKIIFISPGHFPIACTVLSAWWHNEVSLAAVARFMKICTSPFGKKRNFTIMMWFN